MRPQSVIIGAMTGLAASASIRKLPTLNPDRDAIIFTG